MIAAIAASRSIYSVILHFLYIRYCLENWVELLRNYSIS